MERMFWLTFSKASIFTCLRRKGAFSKCSTFKTVDGSLRVQSAKTQPKLCHFELQRLISVDVQLLFSWFSSTSYLCTLYKRTHYASSSSTSLSGRSPPRVFELLKIGSFKFTFSLDFHPTLARLNYFLLGHRRQSNARGLFGGKTGVVEDLITDQSSSRLLIPNNSRR